MTHSLPLLITEIFAGCVLLLVAAILRVARRRTAFGAPATRTHGVQRGLWAVQPRHLAILGVLVLWHGLLSLALH